MDLTVRCHSCARRFDLVADWRIWEERDDRAAYVIPTGKRASCPECGRVHTPGEEMQVTEARDGAVPLRPVAADVAAGRLSPLVEETH